MFTLIFDSLESKLRIKETDAEPHQPPARDAECGIEEEAQRNHHAKDETKGLTIKYSNVRLRF